MRGEIIMEKQKVVYQEKYRKQAMMVKHDRLPRIRHIGSEFIVKSCEITSAGSILVDGIKYEFQDLRVIVKQSEIGSK